MITPIVRLVLLLMTMALGGGAYLFAKTSGLLSPGPLSAAAPRGEPLEGYVSHASFEQNCIHCHAPVHCVTDTRCQDCHLDVARQRAAAEGLHGRLPGTNRCQDCHPEHMGREAVITEFAFANVDHAALSGFSLVKHKVDYDDQPMNCESCHFQNRFVAETLDCLNCHTDYDHTFMAEHIDEFGLDCVACHDGYDRMEGYDHSIYILDGAHTGVACGECHTGDNYRTTPTACADCHADPEIHQNAFGLDCIRCHSTAAWAPAQLTRHTFMLDHGGEGEIACETCHIETYTVYTCYGCHDHTPENMEAAHAAEGLSDYETCHECHPTGRAGEAENLPPSLLGPQAGIVP